MSTEVPEKRTVTENEQTPTNDSSEQSPQAKQKVSLRNRLLATAAGVALVAGGVGVGAAMNAGAEKAPVGVEYVHGEPVYPLPSDPEYDVFAKIGNNSDLAIGDIDVLTGYFTGSDITREALIKALAQANQSEVNRVLEVMANYDDADNVEVTEILNKYGLETNEIPRNMMGRISELNDFTEGELDTVAFNFYSDIQYDDIRDALTGFTQEEINTVRQVVDGFESSEVLNSLFRSHGVELHDGYLG